jgi:hypothetical protein
MEELSFLLSVAILWFLIGKWLDRRLLHESRYDDRMGLREVLVGVLFIAVGLFMSFAFLYEGLDGLRTHFKWGDY